MEASSMITFGPKALPGDHNAVPLCLKTSLSIFPRHLLKNQTISFKKPKKHGLFCVKAENSGDLENTRPLTSFSPSFWGDHFLYVPVADSEFEALEQEIESVLKPKVREMLMSPHSSDTVRIRIIHLLISLGTAHYFESEIEEILHKAFGKLDGLISEEDDLETIAIMFEVFRLYGHKMPCDVFDRFKGEDGKFKESLVKDIRGMLQLYEAAHLGTLSEDIMDEALTFTRYHLESLLTNQGTSSNLLKHVENALYRPRYHSIEILVAKQYISFYDKEEGHDETLLKFAKLNFNFCRLHFIKELKALTKWWNGFDFVSKLPYIRNRTVEIFLGSVALFFEPRYSLGRMITAKLTMIMTVIDDTYDAYATLPEAISLTDALQKWDRGAIENLPDYLKTYFQNLLETVEEIEREMRSRGRSCSVIIDQIKSVGIAYNTLATWSRTGHVPSFDDFMEVVIETAAMDDYASYSLVVMEECEEKQLYEWFESKPKIIHALSVVFRLRNDIATFDQEMSRGEVANGINCYMKQYGVTKEAAVKELSKMIKENYKMMMEELMTSKDVPRQILVRIVNIARVIDVYYKEGDKFGDPDQKMKELLASLFVHPFLL
ncbi:PREDICTED: terpenoid synthase 25-like [Camelina sativa]|uniref:Terpenoid synthase 25-like n=1 Tax=Camelina sativa TaxID=90675 RepID=A0ABM0XN98_CAMSA|nr:PREDICTED: terpenoid synthase 25-like [Camelina sativa]